MSLTLGDNFSYQASKPLDARLKYDTVAAMKAVGDSTMYDGCLAYCVATDKTYQWKSTNTVDATLGKWREYGAPAMPSEDMSSVMTPLPSYSGGSANPTGTIISFMGVYAPQGYLKCDGSVLNISAYARLANFFQEQFGSKNYFGGDGTTTFAVPDLRGEFLRGTGTNSHTDSGNGANVGVHQNPTLIPNYNSYVNSLSKGSINAYMPNSSSQSNQTSNPDSELKPSSGRYYFGASFESVTSDSTYNTAYKYTSRPTNTSVLYCIKD